MSNQEAIALLRNLEDSLDAYCELNEEGKTAFGMAITALELFGNSEQLPPAQPERIKGRWIAKEKKNLFRCSKCDAVIYSESEYDRNEFHKFCGRCGADMREVTT